MTDDERIERLTTLLVGTGATVNDAYGIWVLDTKLGDEHIDQLRPIGGAGDSSETTSKRNMPSEPRTSVSGSTTRRCVAIQRKRRARRCANKCDVGLPPRPGRSRSRL